MRTPKAVSERQQESLRKLLGQVKTKADFQRVQCLWLRADLHMNSTDTARAVGWSQSTVKIIQSRYFQEGEKVLLGKGRGGKRYSNLTSKQEEDLLDSFLKKAKSGGVLVVSEIKNAYEKLSDKKVPKSTIYRMLARHGWRKIAPRPKHPRSDLAVQEEFKKNFLSSSKKK